MNFDKKILTQFVQKSCKEIGWVKIIYAGVVGSSLVTTRNKDIDIIVITSMTPINPSIIHIKRISLLSFTKDWLNYKKHIEKPTGLVPSVLFKSIQLSKPLIGNKNELEIPLIKVCKADWINLELKKKRYINHDKKNYIIALLFEKLLLTSPDLSKYSFNNIEMANKLGEKKIANELSKI